MVGLEGKLSSLLGSMVLESVQGRHWVQVVFFCTLEPFGSLNFSLTMYMLVENHSKSVLHLKRSPGIRSWSLLVGISSVGLAAAYYSEDSLGWKLFYIAGCLFVAVQNLEEWEEVIFEKESGKVFLKTFNLYKKLLTLSRAGHEQVVVPLDEIRAVNVEEEKVRYFGKGYLVVLRFVTGFSHPLTQSAVMGSRSDVEAVAKLITNFLELNKMSNHQDLDNSSETDGSDMDESKEEY